MLYYNFHQCTNGSRQEFEELTLGEVQNIIITYVNVNNKKGNKNMYTKAELLDLYSMDLEDLLKKSQKYLKEEVEFCSIISARTGKCSQNCRYCAQSSHYNTEIETHPLLSVETVELMSSEREENSAFERTSTFTFRLPPVISERVLLIFCRLLMMTFFIRK